MTSPTGYYAAYTVRSNGTEVRSVFPVLHWNADGFPVISNYGGRLVTANAHGKQLEKNMSGNDDLYIQWTVSPYYTP